jgi:putative membrane protein
MGLSVVNELIEFAAVVVSPSTGVGGYVNTLLDLLFNTLGAVSGAVIHRLIKK